MILVLFAMAVLIVGLGFLKFQQIRVAMAQGAWQPPPEAVTTIAARQEQWPATASVIGSVVAVQGVTVSAGPPRIVPAINFESGRKGSAGDVLGKLDVRHEPGPLAAGDAPTQPC